jgi:hypothetical protein
MTSNEAAIGFADAGLIKLGLHLLQEVVRKKNANHRAVASTYAFSGPDGHGGRAVI